MRIALLLLLLPFSLFSQVTEAPVDSTDVEKLEVFEPQDSVRMKIRKATLLSAALPGAGQVYNKRWW
ncbi:MAG: hypothetical protein HKN32_03285, partial [Flavobacteriales bacterium]|nr:hypothetical protein [Flavobacteriales bacterium]